MADDIDRDDLTGTETTGHVWDGIRELDNPMPRWWLWTFYATIIWGLAYTIAYPAWPMISSATSGVLGFSTRGAVAEDIAEARAAQAVYTDRIAALEIDAVAADEELNRFAIAGGAAVFRTYCIQCHGAGGGGAVGYPNLLDDHWLWGGDLDAIYHTVAHGVRWDSDDDTRYSEMPAFGADEILDRSEIASVAEYVLRISGQDHDAALAEAGVEIYEDAGCSGCHGEAGEGNRDLGAPTLNDRIWLYGGDRADIVETITDSRRGVMPSWSQRLTDAQIKQVSVYVHALGGGE